MHTLWKHTLMYDQIQRQAVSLTAVSERFVLDYNTILQTLCCSPFIPPPPHTHSPHPSDIQGELPITCNPMKESDGGFPSQATW